MPRRPTIIAGPVRDGFREVELLSWKDFPRYIARLSNSAKYIFRGQRESVWHLETTLDRARGKLPMPPSLRDHVMNFKQAIRGRRGYNVKELEQLKEDELLALGQHYGLWTPLLDWTESPFVAAYFAFEKPHDTGPGPKRAVWALDKREIASKNKSIVAAQAGQISRPDTLDIIEPLSDDNPRLVSQSGLFSRCNGQIKDWITRYFQGHTSFAILIKIVLPDDRDNALISLNTMNINAKSLFPDVSGAAGFCNMRFAMRNY
ncbi:MAG: FRG domain-containing protein [Candidatus Sumerlaeota bacterium]|nr:FRG domain-containing protein [Candidatus Sumerlaeota bacterium]